jgi:hypothetical protein
MDEGRWTEAEDGGQRSEVRGRGKMDEGRWTEAEDGGQRSEDGGRRAAIADKTAQDLKVYQKTYALAMEIFQLSKYWIHVGLNAKQTEKILAPKNRLLISDL